MERQIAITADSTCDLSPELLKKYRITTIPLQIKLGEENHRDGVDITPAGIFDYVAKTGILPVTSAPTPDDYIKTFERLRDGGKEILHISFGSEMSCSHQNAALAAQIVDGVHIIDSANLSTGSGLLVLKCADLVAAQKDAATICSILSRTIPLVEASFIIDAIEYLYKGGRCSSVAALGANMLHLKPCIEVHDGKMVSTKKYKGSLRRCIEHYVEDRLGGRTDIDPTRVFITHTVQDRETVESAVSAVRALYPFAEVLETIAGCTISSHCGPGTLGVLFIRKEV